MKLLKIFKKIILFLSLLFLFQLIAFSQTVTITYTANNTFVAPYGVSSITVECWGGGGSGGGTTLSTRYGGGGGAGGAYARKVISVTPGTSYTVTVGGTITGTTAAGNTGNPTWFGTVATVYAQGGAGGAAPNGGTANAGIGSSASSIGDLVYAGGSGATGTTARGGAGGGGAGSDGAGGNASGTTAGTGTADNGGNGGAGRTNEGNGNNGLTYGGGGAGSYVPDGTDHSGGNGAAGYMRITYTQPIFYYVGTGALNVPSNWRTSGGLSPNNFTDNYQTFVINNGYTPTNSAAWSISGTNTKLQIENGSSLTENTAITLSANTTFQLDNGATFNHNVNSVTVFGGTESFGSTSNVYYNLNGAQSVVSATYGNVFFSNANSKTLAGAITVVGNLTIDNTVTLDVSATNYAVNVAGDFTNNGTFTQRTGTVTLNGSSAQIIGGSTTTTFYNLTINNTNGGVTLNRPVNIGTATAGTLTLTNGIVTNSTTNIITVLNTATGSVSRTNGWINGFLSRTFLANRTVDGTNYLFPIGNATTYYPFETDNVRTGTTSPVLRVGLVSPASKTTDATLVDTYTHCWEMNVLSGDYISSTIKLYEDTPIPNNTSAVGYAPAPTGTYTTRGSSGTVSGGYISSTAQACTAAGYYIVGKKSIKTYYSYQTGDWNTAGTWTLDPSGTTSESPAVPASGDYVVILNGRIVSITSPNQTVLSLLIEQGATLDIGTTTGHVFTTISGQGLFRLASSTFPLTSPNDWSAFVGSNGGTVEYYGTPASFNLSGYESLANLITYNNLIFNISGVTSTLTGTTSKNLLINNNFTITAGTFRINDNASTTARNVTINGTLTVQSGGNIRIGTANNLRTARHQVTIKGDLKNYGDVRFTNLNAGTYTTNPTDGQCDVIFNNNAKDQYIICNGNTYFERIVIDKGIDWTYILNIDASNAANFQLYGRNDFQNVGTPPTNPPNLTNDNALGLLAGTVRLGVNITIPLLQSDDGSSRYWIDEDARLWIDSASVTAAANAPSTVVYGSLRLTRGSFYNNNEQGLIAREKSQILIEGGFLSTPCIRTSAIAGTHRGTYIQSGGKINVTGNATAGGGYASFTYPYTENSFIMSGGELNILAPTTVTGNGLDYSFVVGSNANNNSVSGGSINITIPATSNVYFTSSSPFWNLNFTSTSNTYSAQISALAASNPPPAVAAYPLVVYNDLSLQNYAVLNPNNQPVTIGGNFNIAQNANYTTGTNTTIFNGSNGQAFNVERTTGFNGLYHFIVADGSNLKLTGSQTNLNVSGDLTIGSLSVLDDFGKTITLTTSGTYPTALGNITNSGTHKSVGTGGIIISETAVGSGGQGLWISGDGNGIFGNLSMNNTRSVGSNAVKFKSAQTITNTLSLNNGVLNIDIYNLTFKNRTSSAVTGSWGASNMIRTAGNQSDGGITKYFSNTQTSFTYPCGTFSTSDDYSPASLTMATSSLTSYGAVTVKPVKIAQPYAIDAKFPLKRYWKVEENIISTNASVNMTFQYVQTDVQGNEGNYVNAVYRPYSWTKGAGSPPVNVNTTGNVITFSGQTTINGDYTAGETDAFPAAVTVFYSKQNGNWFDPNTWSNVSNSGTDIITDYPGADNPVVIGDGVSNNHTVYTDADNALAGSMALNKNSVLDLKNKTGHNFGALPNLQVGGTGTLKISCKSGSSVAEFPKGDFGAFIGASGGTVIYYSSTNWSAAFSAPILSASSLQLTTYCNLGLVAASGTTVTMPNPTTYTTTMTVYGNMFAGEAGNTGTVYLNTAASSSLNINGNLSVITGMLSYNNTFAQEVSVTGDVSVANGATFIASTTATGANKLTVSGNLTNNGNITFLNGSGICNLTFTGIESKTFTGTGSGSTILNNLIINKGINLSSILTLDVGGTLTVPTTASWLTLSNGTFSFQKNSTITLVPSTLGATTFTIPATACLEINNSGGVINVVTANNSSADLLLNGKLAVTSGTINIGSVTNTLDNDIEYSPSGSPEINIGTGTLNVYGQIKNNDFINTGSLVYQQTGGNNNIFGINPNTSKAMLMIYNTGSVFNMSGGTITIMTGGGTSSFGDLYINPETSSVTGGNISFNGAGQTFNMVASVPLYNLNCLNGTSVTLNIAPLVLKGSLLINPSNEFIVNALDVTIGAHFYNNGVYTVNKNYTIFNGASDQNIDWNTTSTNWFYNLQVNKTGGTLGMISSGAITTSINITNDLSITQGSFDTKNIDCIVRSNVYNSAAHLSTGTGSIYMNKTDGVQYISGNGSGIFGRLKIDNSYNVNLTSNASITKELYFVNGYLYIDDNLLTLSKDAIVSNTNLSRFIVLNGALSDLGVKKQFNTSGSGSFTVPVGTILNGASKYTPAKYSYATAFTGDITTKPINSKHFGTTDVNNYELNYHWNVVSSQVMNSTSLTIEFQYINSDLQGYLVTDYYGGWLPLNSVSWQKYGTVINGTPSTGGTIQFVNPNATIPSTYIDGDYTAGRTSEFGTIKTYYSRDGDANVTNTSVGGNWDNPSSWSVVSHSGSSDGTYPQGHRVIIKSGHRINANGNSRISISLLLNGILNLYTYNLHDFGTVSGAGRMILDPNGSSGNIAFVFPGGEYSTFMNTQNATVEYHSNVVAVNSNLSPTINNYQNIEFTGTGIKMLSLVNLLVRGNLSILGSGLVDNSNFNVDINLYNNWLNSSGTRYNPGTGNVNFNYNSVYTTTSSRNIDGTGETFYNLNFNNTDVCTLKCNLNVNNNLTINANAQFNGGTTKTIYLTGNWINNSGSFSCSTSSVTFNNTVNQTISSTGTETFYNLAINNPTNVTANCNTGVNNILNILNGKYIIGKNKLTLGTSSIVNSTATRYIVTNGLSSDAGVTKSFNASTFTFTFPIGTLTKYTPAAYTNSNTLSTAGTINVIPVNQRHPYAIDNLKNELQYYWSVTSTGFTTLPTITHTYTFIPADLYGTTQVAPRFYNGQWFNSGASEGSVTSPNITYSAKTYIDGDYTCGEQTNFENHEIFYSYKIALSDWNQKSTWTTDKINITNPNYLPNNNAVVIQNTTNVYTNLPNIKISSLLLEGNGYLNLNSTSGHVFNTISGTGTLEIHNSGSVFIIPDPVLTNYSAFVSGTGGGTIIYAGYGSLPTTLNTYNNLELNGSGNINLSIPITINGKLTIRSGTLFPFQNNTISIAGDWIDYSVYNSTGTGKVTFNGSSLQNIASYSVTPLETFNDIELNNNAGLSLLSPVNINGNLSFTNGIITTTSTNILTINSASGTVSGARSNAFVDGPLQKKMGDGGSFDFPVGDNSRYGNIGIGSISVQQTVCAEYMNSAPPSSTSIPQFTRISTNEYWKITAPTDASTTGNVTLRWDATSNISNDLSLIKILKWNYTTSEWEDVPGPYSTTGNSTTGTITVSNVNLYGTSAQPCLFTLAKELGIYTWTGDGFTNKWSDPTNWSLNDVPFDGIRVKVPNVTTTVGKYHPSVDVSSATCTNLEIHTGAWVYVQPTKSLIITNSLSFLTGSGGIVLESNALGTSNLLVSHVVVETPETAIIEQQLFVTGNKYHYISSPMSSKPITDFSITHWGAVNPNFYFYDESNTSPAMKNPPILTWLDNWTFPNTTDFVVGKGYAFLFPYDNSYSFSVSPSAMILNNQTINITNTSHAGFGYTGNLPDGWNLVGNPYNCAIDAIQFLNANTTTNGSVYFWVDDGSEGNDYSSSDYAVYTQTGLSTGVYTGGGTQGGVGTTISAPNGIISPIQGFFINTNADATCNFTPSMRTAASNTFYKKKMAKNIQQIRLSVKNQNGVYNETLLVFSPNATNEDDWGYDAIKLKGNKNLAFYSIANNKEYAIQALPDLSFENGNRIIPLGIDAAISGEYIIKANEIVNIAGVKVYLEDKKFNSFIDLSVNPEYKLYLDKGSVKNRLSIRFSATSDLPVIEKDNSIQIYSYDSKVYVNINNNDNISGKIIICNSLGQILVNKTITNEYQYTIPINSGPGVYTVNVIVNGTSKTGKVFIK